MKTLKNIALVLGLVLMTAGAVRAEGFLDMYGGISKFGTFDETRSFTQSPSYSVTTNQDYPNSRALDSYVAGFRVGNTWKWEKFNLSLGYDNSFYNVGAVAVNNNGAFAFPANGQGQGTYWRDSLGGTVWQPGVDLIAGLPLKYFRAYAGYGLIMPVMFYNYTGLDKTQNMVTYNKTGASAAIGGHFLIGGRWFITKRLNLMVEDRFQNLYTPMVIKNTARINNGTVLDSSITFKDLPANQFLVGVGFAFGGVD